MNFAFLGLAIKGKEGLPEAIDGIGDKIGVQNDSLSLFHVTVLGTVAS